MVKKLILTWKQWNDQYKPIYDDEGNLKHDSVFTEGEWMQIVKEHRNRTPFGGGNGVSPYFLAGHSRAKDDFVATEIPWSKEEESIRVDY